MTLRLVLAVSLDGRLAPPGGGAAQLGGAGDRLVLEEALAWADAAVVGAGTVRAHGCSCLIHRPELQQQRQSRGQSPQPPLLIASRQATPVGFDPAWRLWGQPLQLWWLSSAPLLAAPPAGFARQLALESWQGLLAQLNAEGHQRVLLLGGASWLGPCSKRISSMSCSSPSARWCWAVNTAGCRFPHSPRLIAGCCRSSAP